MDLVAVPISRFQHDTRSFNSASQRIAGCSLPGKTGSAIPTAEYVNQIPSEPLSDSRPAAAGFANGSSTDDDTTTTIHRTSTIQSTITIPASSQCTQSCIIGQAERQSWDWPVPQVTNITVATLVYKIDNATNQTSTSIKYNTTAVTDGQYTTLDDAAWSHILNTTGVHVVDNTPTLTYKVPVHTDVPATATIILTTLLYVFHLHLPFLCSPRS